MLRRPPSTTRPHTLVPYTTLFRSAVRNVSPSLLAMCRSFQGTPMQQVLKIVIPDASPVIFAGLRLGVSAGFVGVVLAELLITPTGIGDLITYHRAIAGYPEMYARSEEHTSALQSLMRIS